MIGSVYHGWARAIAACHRRVLLVMAAIVCLAAPALGDWGDNFDAYPNGSELNGLGGWEVWPGGGSAEVSNEFWCSPPHSARVEGNDDAVHRYSGYAGAVCVYTACLYIPSGFQSGGAPSERGSYFILLNAYSPAVPHWSVQLHADSDTHTFIRDGVTPASLPLVYDRPVEVRVEINLCVDEYMVYYDGQPLGTPESWTAGVYGQGGGQRDLAAVDLYANDSSPVYWDDMLLVADVEDCNENGRPDHLDILLGFSKDCDKDCRPDECRCADDVTEAGTRDNFTGPEPADPGDELLGIMGCNGARMDFDDLTADQCFGHTFRGLPALIRGATLEIRLRALTSVPFNDTLSLQVDRSLCEPHHPVWSRYIGSGGSAPGLLATPWTMGAEHTFILDLAALPNVNGPSTDLLPYLFKSRRLDIYVQDDTAVDYAELRFEVCEDCNNNGQLDSCDIASQISADCNNNLIPDECEACEGHAAGAWSPVAFLPADYWYERELRLENYYNVKVGDVILPGEHIVLFTTHPVGYLSDEELALTEIGNNNTIYEGVKRAKKKCDDDECQEEDTSCNWYSEVSRTLYHERACGEQALAHDVDVRLRVYDVNRPWMNKHLRDVQADVADLRRCLEDPSFYSTDAICDPWRDGGEDEALDAVEREHLGWPLRLGNNVVWGHRAEWAHDDPAHQNDQNEWYLRSPAWTGNPTDLCELRKCIQVRNRKEGQRGYLEYKWTVNRSEYQCQSGEGGQLLAAVDELRRFRYLQLNGSELYFDLLVAAPDLKDPAQLSGSRTYLAPIDADHDLATGCDDPATPYLCGADCMVVVSQSSVGGGITSTAELWCWTCDCPGGPLKWVLQTAAPYHFKMGPQRIQFTVALSDLGYPCNLCAWAVSLKDDQLVSSIPESPCLERMPIEVQVDQTCPRVLAVDTSDVQGGLPDHPVVVEFDEPMGAIGPGDIAISPPANFAVIQDATGHVLYIQPAPAFAPGVYTLTLKTSIVDPFGNALNGKYPHEANCGHPYVFDFCVQSDSFRSVDTAGVATQEFADGQQVYVEGEGFPDVNRDVALYLVIPYSYGAPAGMLVDQSDDGWDSAAVDGTGVLARTRLGQALRPGIYTVVMDVNFNGVFDAPDHELQGCDSGLLYGAPCGNVMGDEIAWWPLDEMAHSEHAAELVDANHARRLGNPLPVSGVVNGALEFNGTTDYLEAASADSLDIGSFEFSIDGWLRVALGSDGGGILAKGAGSGRGYALDVLPVGGAYAARLVLEDGMASFAATSPPAIPAAAWTHLAVSGAAELDGGVALTFYVNGQPLGSHVLALGDTPENTAVLWIGRSLTSGLLEGALDEVTLYDGTLSENDARFLYNSGAAGHCRDRAGDLNCDGEVDFGDINAFVKILSNPGAWAAQFLNCPLDNGDVNADGNVDFGDINPFIKLLTNQPE